MTEENDTFKEEIEALKKANRELLSELKETRNKLRTVGEVDPDEYKALKAAKDQRDEEEAQKKGEYDRLLKDKEEKYARELAAVRKRAEDLEQKIVSEKRRTAVVAALSELGGSVDLLGHHIESRVKVEEVNGDYKVVVLDRDGHPMTTKKGDAASVKDLVEEFKSNEVFGVAFKATDKAGAGTSPVAASKTPAGYDGKNPYSKDSPNMTKQWELEESNPELAASLKAQAGA